MALAAAAVVVVVSATACAWLLVCIAVWQWRRYSPRVHNCRCGGVQRWTTTTTTAAEAVAGNGNGGGYALLLRYDGHYGGLNNQILALFCALHLAQRLPQRAAVVLPPVYSGGRAVRGGESWFDYLHFDERLPLLDGGGDAGAPSVRAREEEQAPRVAVDIHRQSDCERFWHDVMAAAAAITSSTTTTTTRRWKEAAADSSPPPSLSLRNTYGLVRCFTDDEEFLRLWQRIRLRDVTGGVHRHGRSLASITKRARARLSDATITTTTTTTTTVVIALHIRASGFEARAHQRQPTAYPAPDLLRYILGPRNDSGDDEEHAATVAPATPQWSALRRLLRPWCRAGVANAEHNASITAAAAQQQQQQRKRKQRMRAAWSLAASPTAALQLMVLHDGKRESVEIVRALRDLLAQCTSSPSCGLVSLANASSVPSPPSAPMLTYAHAAADMYAAIHDAHIFVGSPLSTLSSNVARWRHYALGCSSPSSSSSSLSPMHSGYSLTYTGVEYLRAIPNMLGFH